MPDPNWFTPQFDETVLYTGEGSLGKADAEALGKIVLAFATVYTVLKTVDWSVSFGGLLAGIMVVTLMKFYKNKRVDRNFLVTNQRIIKSDGNQLHLLDIKNVKRYFWNLTFKTKSGKKYNLPHLDDALKVRKIVQGATP